MKNLSISILVVLFSFGYNSLYSQEYYKSAAGLRFDWVLGSSSGPSADYKVFLSDKFALEGLATFRFSNPSSFSLTVLGEIHNDLGINGLQWYAGAGPGFVIVDSSTDFNLVGVVGLDYSFGSIPIGLLIDVFPTIRFKPDFDVNLPLSFGIRYILSR